MINSQLRASYWMTLQLTIVNFNHFLIQPAPAGKDLNMSLYVIRKGASVAQSSEQVPFTSEIVGSILTTDSREKSESTLCRKSWVFSGRSG